MRYRPENTSNHMKLACLSWLRFKKRVFLVATEAGYYSSDVLGCDENYCYELEVKSTISDFFADFKKRKHLFYEQLLGSKRVIPNYFYMVVPPELEMKALTKLKDENPKYGLIIYTPVSTFDMSNCLKVVKRGGRLHEEPPSPKMKRDIQMRMGSELISSYSYKLEFLKKIENKIETVESDFYEQVREKEKVNDNEST